MLFYALSQKVVMIIFRLLIKANYRKDAFIYIIHNNYHLADH